MAESWNITDPTAFSTQQSNTTAYPTSSNTNFGDSNLHRQLEKIFDLACNQLSALSTRFVNRSGNAQYSLATLFAELDAFKARFTALSTVTPPQYLLNQHALPSFSDNSDLDPCLAPCLNGIGASTRDNSLGQAFLGFGDLSSGAEQSLIARPPSKAGDVASQIFYNTGATVLHNEPNNYVGMNEGAFQSFPDPRGVQGSFSGELATFTPDFDIGISTADAASISLDWDSLINSGLGPSMQGLQSFEAPASDQSNNVQAISALAPPSANPFPVAIARGSNLKHACGGCTKTFSRRADRDRHANSHNPNAPRFPCPAPGCSRDFPRKDKLLDHQRRMRH